MFEYNRSVSNINVTNIHSVYNQRVVNNVTVNHVSYNGGAGGARLMETTMPAIDWAGAASSAAASNSTPINFFDMALIS